MDQEKIGNFIKDIRVKNNLTQKEFADILLVTPQAVSKWERGLSIPDISVLSDISKRFNVNVDDIINGKKRKFNYKYIIIIISVLIILVLTYIISSKSDFEFKTISSTCNDFTISGSIAFKNRKSYLYLSNINYCGGDDTSKYNKITCTVYEKNGTNIKELDKINYAGDGILLETFLEDIDFKLDDFSNNCKFYTNESLYLEIEATDISGKTNNYKIPLSINDTCKK